MSGNVQRFGEASVAGEAEAATTDEAQSTSATTTARRGPQVAANIHHRTSHFSAVENMLLAQRRLLGQGVMPPLWQQQQQHQTNMNPAAFLPEQSSYQNSSQRRIAILQRLNDIAREQQEIEQARAVLMRQQQQQQQQQQRYQGRFDNAVLSFPQQQQTNHATSSVASSNDPAATRIAPSQISGRVARPSLFSCALDGGLVGSSAQPPASMRMSSLQEEKIGSIIKQGEGSKRTSKRRTRPPAAKNQNVQKEMSIDIDAAGDAVAREGENKVEEEEDEASEKKRVTFPLKLYQLLQDVERDGNSHIISWQPNGTSFAVRRPKEFVAKLMPKYFGGGTKMNTFQKQLNLYSFKRINSGKDKGAYFHKDFVKGKPEECKSIKRQHMTRSKKPLRPSSASVASGASSSRRPGVGFNAATALQLQQQDGMQHSGSILGYPNLEMDRIRRTQLLSSSMHHDNRLDRISGAITSSRYQEQQDEEGKLETQYPN